MFTYSLRIKPLLIISSLVTTLICVPGSLLAKTYKVDCGKGGDLQKTIDSAVNGDTVEITGICMTNARIDGKDLTLVGASSPGPHGITGVAPDTPALTISRSNSTYLVKLSISNSAAGGVYASYSTVSMSGCTVSNNTFNGIIGFHASRVYCLECDLNNNLRYAAFSSDGSAISLQDSIVTGNRGILANANSYVDIDCQAFITTHACSLNANWVAGAAFERSTVAFYAAGDFWGQVAASDRSEAQLFGARQQSTGVVSASNSNPRHNEVSSGASLRVEPFNGSLVESSRLMGTTDVSEFSHALLYGASTVLDGVLNCASAGDAWVDPAVNLIAPGFSINGCDHAP